MLTRKQLSWSTRTQSRRPADTTLGIRRLQKPGGDTGAGSCVGDAWSLHWGALSVPYPRLYGNPPFSELHKLPAKVEEYLAGPPSPTLGPPQQPPRLLFHEEKNPHAFSGAAPALVLILPQWNTPAIASLRATALEEVHLGRIGFRAPGGGATLEAPPWATLALRWRRDP